MSTRDYYYANMTKLPDGRTIPITLHGNKEQAVEHDRFNWYTRKRFEFIPLSDDRRFRVVYSDYSLRIHRDWNPDSLVQLPPEVKKWGEYVHEPQEVVSRCDGLADVARLNRELLNGGRLDPSDDEWCFLIELGPPLELNHTCINITENGIGCERRNIEYPVWIVKPTQAELELYATAERQEGAYA